MDYTKVEKFFAKELTKNLKDIMIVRNDDGSYDLFGKYKVIIDTQGNYKVHVLDSKKDVIPQVFASLKHAVTWCVFEKHNKYTYIRRVQELDEALSSLNVAIAQHKKLILKSSTEEDRAIFYAKLVEEKLKKKALVTELESYITTSKKWQSKRFDEMEPR